MLGSVNIGGPYKKFASENACYFHRRTYMAAVIFWVPPEMSCPTPKIAMYFRRHANFVLTFVNPRGVSPKISFVVVVLNRISRGCCLIYTTAPKSLSRLKRQPPPQKSFSYLQST